MGSPADSLASLLRLPAWDGKSPFGIETPRKLLAALGNPQDQVASIHVAGTNGKGSVCAFLASILFAAGHSVGQFTSPHLVNINERCVLNGLPISLTELSEFVQKVLFVAEREGITASFFEIVTAASFLAFAERRLDWMVIEVGLGGRLDATNVMQKPKASVITNIGYDHTQLLGDTLTLIAQEKAGILRPAVPVFCGAMPEEAQRVITECANSLGAPIRCFGKDFFVDQKKKLVLVSQPQQSISVDRLSLLGQHQYLNAALAAEVASFLGLTSKNIERGFEATLWPGRLEWIRPVQLANREILLDGAHNPDGVKRLCEYLFEYVGSLEEKRAELVILFSVLYRKNWQAMLELLGEFAMFCQQQFQLPVRLVFTHCQENAAVAPSELASYFASRFTTPEKIPAEVRIDCFEALSELMQNARGTNSELATTVVVTGSLHLVGKLRPRLCGETFRTIRSLK